MIFTFYYMYATILQWWRLGSLKNKLNGTLNTKNALLLSHSKTIHTCKRQRSIENLLFHVEDRIACTIVPKQNVNLSHWVIFPKDPRNFPIRIDVRNCSLKPPFIYLMVRTVLENYTKHECEAIQIEHFGEPVAWKAASKFEVLVKTDLDHLTKLVHSFWNSAIDINHDLEMIEIETVNLDGNANKIKYERKYSLGETMKYSHSPVHWKKFSTEVRNLYLKIRENSNPKIKIENGATKSEEQKKVPVYEVKPIKKESKKQIEDKNTLEVGGGDHRRHKAGEKRDKSSEEKYKSERKTRDDSPKTKDSKTEPLKTKVKNIPSKSDVVDKCSEKHIEHPSISSHKHRSDSFDKPVKSSLDHSNKTVEKKVRVSESQKSDIKRDRSEKAREDSEHKAKSKESKPKIKTSETDSKKSSKQDEPKKEKRRSDSKELSKKSVVVKEHSSKIKVREKSENSTEENTQETTLSEEACVKPKISERYPDSKLKVTVNAKPPNILVYADSVTAKENVKTVLNSVINTEKYIVYDFPSNTSNPSVWGDSTNLVVICGVTNPDLTSQLLQYLVSGGQLLCLCSDLLHSILSVFTTAEVREHELVRFTYGEWKRVRMMHHIFCYQASPAKKQFSKDSVESNHSNGSSPIAPRTPSTAEIQHNGKSYTLQVQVLGTEETWQTPSLLLANVKNSKGRAVFSQVHLEIDPLQYEDDESKYSALKDSNQARIEILTDILRNRLEIDCTRSSSSVTYTPAYFLGRHEMKMDMFSECKEIVDNTLNCDEVTLVFCGKNIEPGIATARRLPVMLYSCPSTFSTVDYFSTLSTDSIGRLVIYADIMKSSQHILSKTIKHGLVVIPRQMTGAKGRSKNTWLSPIGSASFSLQLHIPLSSPLGRMLSIVQQLVAVAILEAVKKSPGYERMNIGLKWPNDIYVNKSVKIGGILVNSTVGNKMVVMNIGCGFNLDNSEPTMSLNDYIQEYNTEYKKNLPRMTHEKYFAMVFNEIENLYDIVQNDNVDQFYDLYYKHWIHQDAKIKIETGKGTTQNATIIGIDDFGFLKVKLESGEISEVHPDGNTFDMIKGLIAPKPSYRE